MDVNHIVCRVIAGHVEDGKITDAIMAMASYGMQAYSSSSFSVPSEPGDQEGDKPTIHVDLHGEDGNIYWLTARTIHALVKNRKETSACEVLINFYRMGDYEKTVSFLKTYVSMENSAK